MHCINIEVKDNHEDSLVGAQDAVKLAQQLKAATDLDDEIGDIVCKWSEETGRTKTFLHTFFY